MTREEHLFYCKKCKHRELNITQGLLCKLSGKLADFEGECPTYELDKSRLITVAPTEEVKPNAQRAALAQNLIWAVLIMDLISLVSSYMQYDLLLLLEQDLFVFDGELENNDTRESIVGLGYTLVYIVSAITFILWFRRAYYNLSVRVKTQYGEGWAVWSWFVPIISLYRPYKIMDELYERTQYLIKQRLPKAAEGNYSAWVGLWWGLWLISNYIGKYVFNQLFDADSIASLMKGTMADMVLSIVNIPLGILVIYLIKSFDKKEVQLSQLESKVPEEA